MTCHGRDWMSHCRIRASELGLLLQPMLGKPGLGTHLATAVPRPVLGPHQLVFLEVVNS